MITKEAMDNVKCIIKFLIGKKMILNVLVCGNQKRATNDNAKI